MKSIYNPFDNKWQRDTLAEISKHDVVYRSPVLDSTYGLPIGDGDTGCLLWLSEDGLQIQINKTDLWDDTTHTELDGCSCYEENLTSLRHAARLFINFNMPCFELLYQKDYEARLSLSNATVTINSKTPFSEVDISAFASTDQKVTVLECDFASEQEVPVEIGVERWGSRNMWFWYSHMLRNPEVGLDGTQIKTEDNRICIIQRLNTMSFCVGVHIISNNKCDTSRVHNHKSKFSLNSYKNMGFKLYITVEVSITAEEAEQNARKNLDKAIRSENIYTEHCNAWKEFWEKSFISIPDDFIENLWYLNLYYANSECKGKYPPHFCNGIWSFYRDFVPWNFYFHYNMQLHNFPLHTANHPELLENYYEFKRNQLPNAIDFCTKHKGVTGAFYTDVYDRNGKNMLDTANNCTCGAQVAMDMWKHYKYTNDERFLNEIALPVMKSVGEFYINMLKKGDDGVYHIYATQAYESSPLLDDSITDLSMIRALFAALVRILPDNEGTIFSEILNNLAPFHYLPLENDEIDGNILTQGLGKGSFVKENNILSIGKLSDTENWIRRSYGNPNRDSIPGFPDTELSPLFPSGAVGLSNKGGDIYEALVNQVRIHCETIPPSSTEENADMTGGKGLCMGWCMTPIYLARLGLAKELKKQLEQTAGTWIIFPQGFGIYGPYKVFNGDNNLRWKKNNVRDVLTDEIIHLPAWNFRHFDYETLPIIATAVNEMLLQSYDGIIRLFPAVFRNDTVMFSLLAEGGFLINAEQNTDGFLVSIESIFGKECHIKLPSEYENIFCYQIVRTKAYKRGFTSIRNDLETILSIPIEKCQRYVICSYEIEKTGKDQYFPPKRNNDVKFYQKSKLGEERMF